MTTNIRASHVPCLVARAGEPMHQFAHASHGAPGVVAYFTRLASVLCVRASLGALDSSHTLA